ncbi:hypothetical protein, partial [Mycobacterium avium]|uniref:hypothetical protein n=1 Tax=Mycobacterium avium TaxID=1764 RepID=UPI001E534A4F
MYAAGLAAGDRLAAHAARPGGFAARTLETVAPLPNPIGLTSPAFPAHRCVIRHVDAVPTLPVEPQVRLRHTWLEHGLQVRRRTTTRTSREHQLARLA